MHGGLLGILLSVTGPKFRLDQKSLDQKSLAWQKDIDLWPPNVVRSWTWVTPRSTLKVKSIGQICRSPGYSKTSFHVSFHTIMCNMFMVKGQMDRNQRSVRSRSKLMWASQLMILAGGFMSTSSCIFHRFYNICRCAIHQFASIITCWQMVWGITKEGRSSLLPGKIYNLS